MSDEATKNVTTAILIHCIHWNDDLRRDEGSKKS